VRDELVDAVADEVLGLGPVEPLIRDVAITEVMVNAPDQVFYEKEGRLYLSSVRFRDHSHIMRIVERIVAPLGRRVDESSPMVDARLPDGSRVNVIIPPVAPKSPTLTIESSGRQMTIGTHAVGSGRGIWRSSPRLRPVR
jgi:pilus assembly protein CpaF